MKFKNLLLTAIIGFFICGCQQLGYYLVENPLMDALGNALVGKHTSIFHARNVVDMPKQIEFDGEIYTDKFNMYEHAKFYLDGENDGGQIPTYTGWTKMIRVFVTTKDESIDKTISSIKRSYNKRDPKPIFTLTKLDETKMLEKALFLPIKEKKIYDNYYITISVKERKCGVYVNVFYDMVFDGSASKDEMLKIMDERAEYFLQNYPKLKCKNGN
nr:hypothetical protein [Campylobacter sp.]